MPAPPLLQAWNCLNALGNIAFAFSFSLIVLEVEDTLKEPPAAMVSMKKTGNGALAITMFFYLMLSIFGYGALGNSVPGDILTGFDNPVWLIVFANIMVRRRVRALVWCGLACCAPQPPPSPPAM